MKHESKRDFPASQLWADHLDGVPDLPRGRVPSIKPFNESDLKRLVKKARRGGRLNIVEKLILKNAGLLPR